MRGRTHANRLQEIQEALLSANAGYLLIFILVIGLPLAGIGVFFVILGLNMMYDQARLNDVAIAVPATVVSSRVQRSTTRGQPDSGGTTSYWADIHFTYAYEGKVRTSDKVWPVGEGQSEAAIRRIVARYPAGAQVSAFIIPDDPDTAFLEKRWSHMPYISVCVGCLPAVFLTGLGVLLAGWRRPGIAMLIAAVLFGIVSLQFFVVGNHYLRTVPAGERVWWSWLIMTVCWGLTLGLPGAVIKMKQLNRLYRQAVKDSGTCDC